MATGAAAKTPTKLSAPAAPKTPSKPSATAAVRTPAKLSAPATAAAKTPSKSASRARFSQASENSDPNILCSPPPPPSKTPAKSPATASARKKRCTPAPAPPPPVPQRRFLVAKKGARRRRDGASGGGELDFDKCRETARQALRASQEEFFRKERAASAATEEQLQKKDGDEEKVAEEEANSGAFEEGEDDGMAELEGSSKMRAIRSRVMAKAMNSVPDSGAGRVKHLVHAFESLLSISSVTSDADRAGEGSWALPGLQPWKEEGEGEGDVGIPPLSEFSSSDFLNAGPSRLCTSLDSNSDRSSWDSRTSAGGRKSRRNSSESLRSSWNKKLKVTSKHPFKLRTEQRGRAKEQQFIQKVQEMLMEDEKKRIHVAQGLPWTTDEPECLIKPPVKERTEPVDLVLHSDVRAVERAEFDQYVSERIQFGEQLRLERERQQKLEEEEMIRQLRKELVPKAQPMPYFDRPFIPKRSTKTTTIPKEPNFQPRPEKLSCYCRQRCMDTGKLKSSPQCERQLHLSRTAEHRHT